MKTMTAFAAMLAAGMALAPMAASAATITFFGDGSGGWALIGSAAYGGEDETLSGYAALDSVDGEDTPKNAGERRDCESENGPCVVNFQTGENLSISTRSEFDEEVGDFTVREYEWKGGGLLRILEPETAAAAATTLLTGTFAEPVTATVRRFFGGHGTLEVAGVLTDVVIDEDLAAFYGVPNSGTGEIRIRGDGLFDPDPSSFEVSPDVRGTVTFSPVPVPAGLPLMLTALAGLGLIRSRQTQAA